jgi:hypothetical protein
MLAIALVLVLPLSAALASHGQDSDTGNATCPSLYGKLYGNAYAHEWQQQTHDGGELATSELHGVPMEELLLGTPRGARG